MPPPFVVPHVPPRVPPQARGDATLMLITVIVRLHSALNYSGVQRRARASREPMAALELARAIAEPLVDVARGAMDHESLNEIINGLVEGVAVDLLSTP